MILLVLCCCKVIGNTNTAIPLFYSLTMVFWHYGILTLEITIIPTGILEDAGRDATKSRKADPEVCHVERNL